MIEDVDHPRTAASARSRIWGAMLIVAGTGVCVFAVVVVTTQLVVLGTDPATALALAPGFAVATLATVAVIAGGAWIAAARVLPRRAEAAPSAQPVASPVETPDDEAREEALEEAREEAAEESRQLLDDVRHELKTPITIVRGYLETMDVTDPADVANTREIGISELDRMSRLVEDIELLASLEGAERLSLGAVDLRTLTDRIGELVAVIPGHPWQVAEHGDAILHADPDRLLQAWLQLADNAAKYTPEGSPVELGSTLSGDRARLWVRDHGPGVPPAARHRIFRRFDRAHSGRGVDGSGLGLAIVDAIARAHEGVCSVVSTEGGGATFTIEVPVGHAAPTPPAPVRAEDVVQQREATR